MRAGGVEERHRQQRRRLMDRLGPYEAADDPARLAVQLPRQQRGDDVPVRAHHALRISRRARRVEDHRVVGRPDAGLRHRSRRHVAQQVAELRDAVLRPIPAPGGDRLHRHRVRAGGQPLQPLAVREQHRGPAVDQPVLHLLGLPQRVEADGDRADRRHGHEAHDPLGVVAHRDRDAVALADPVAVDQQPPDAAGRRVGLLVAVALVVVDEERQVAAVLGEQRPQRRRGVLEHPHLVAALHGPHELVRLPRRGQLRQRFLPCRHRSSLPAAPRPPGPLAEGPHEDSDRARPAPLAADAPTAQVV